MYLPLSWLRELVELDGIDLKTIEDSLFSCGLEVEERVPVAPDVSGVYVGRVKHIERHPDSDHMFVCIVDCGDKGSDIQIVTGAQNVHEGDVVPAALDGARVYGRRKGDDTRPPEVATIKNGKLRGVASNGMLCSGEELGIDDNWYEGAEVNGIMMLPQDAPLGADVKTILGLDDEVWDISVTANLPHCQHVYGVARELAALLDRPLHTPDLSFTPVAKPKSISIRVDAPDLCPRYIGHYVYDVQIKKSPELIRRRLHMCGINAINTIVDITNYVLVEFGQPMHAFDLNNVTDNTIIVRRAEQGEKIVTLDEREFTLSTDNLVICDAARPVALAGIMGGLNSEITDATNEVLFEAAKFDRGNVRRTSRSLGQSSDSSHRFEKGVDAYTTGIAMQRALHLIEELDCGKVGDVHIDVVAEDAHTCPAITTTFSAINAVLGIDVPVDTITAILGRMNYTLDVDGDCVTATPPAYREDIEGSAADLAEDVIKMYGYEHIVPRFMTNAAITSGGLNRDQMNTAAFKSCLAAQGFCETVNYSFYSTAELDMLALPENAPQRDVVRVSNPLSEKYTIMRTTLAPSLINVLSTNSKRGNENVRIYEIANIFIPRGEALPIEQKRFCFALYGKGESFFTAKGVLETLATKFGLQFSYQRDTRTFLHPGACAKVLCGKQEVGFFGQLSYEIADNCDIAQSAFIGEIDYEALLGLFANKLTYAPVSPYRDIHRDLALLAPEAMTCGEIEAVIRSACKSVSEVRLFDVYRGGQVPEGHKSMAFALTFTPEDKELLPEDADKFITKILKSLEYRLGLKMRS